MKKILTIGILMFFCGSIFGAQLYDGGGVQKATLDYDNSMFCFVTTNNVNCFFYIDSSNGNSKLFQAQLAMALSGTINITQIIYDTGDTRVLDGITWNKVKRLYVQPK
jgi:hypothetical protein